VIPLGTSGGEFENNLSAYLVAPVSSDRWVTLDAGTLCSGIKNIPTQTLNEFNSRSRKEFFDKQIKAYLISHAHLDHISGLITCSTTDTHKEILGISSTLDYLRDYIFNWKIWPNFSDEGFKPLLKTYHYHYLSLDANILIPNTNLSVRPFILNHGNGYPSTAFLLESNKHYLLYFGDTGADKIEHSQDIHKVWEAVAPLIREGKLRTIFIESSYSNDRPDSMLFGHLTPHLILDELQDLAILVDQSDPRTALNGMKIVVTHIKQGLGQNNQMKIIQELRDKNNLGVEFILPHPGIKLEL
jgi:3',5'-cyclic-nucleotide phosphodiesterase